MSNVPGILKSLRAERGVTQDDLATAVQVSKSLVAAFENRRLIPQPDTACRMAEFFGSGDKVRKASAEATQERKRERAQQPTWFKPWREIEETASILRYFELGVVPGLLQTEEYARSVLASGPHSPAEIDERLTARLERQAAILNRANPPMFAFIMDAAVLRFGDPRIAKDQLLRLVEVGDQDNIFVQVVPDKAVMHPGRSVSFALATLDTGNTAGYMEDLFEGRVVTDPVRVTGLERAWQTICAVALNVDQSRELILKMVDDL